MLDTRDLWMLHRENHKEHMILLREVKDGLRTVNEKLEALQVSINSKPKAGFNWKPVIESLWPRVILFLILAGTGALSIKEAIQAAIR